MSTFDATSYYYSGQGVMMLGDRTALGRPAGLIPVGNVSDLKLGLASTVVQHKESQSGNRATDLRLTTELSSTISFTLENFTAENLATALNGGVTATLGATVASESVLGYLGKVMPLANIMVSNFTLKVGATSLTAYTNDSTAWDYKYNPNAGSFKLNDGQGGQLIDKLTTGGTAPTAIVVGSTTQVTVTVPAGTKVGDYAVFTGFTGADAAILNGKAFQIVQITSNTDVYLNVDTTGKTITVGTPLSFFDATSLDAGYDFTDYNRVDAMTNLSNEKYVRFEGLNTADSGKPVIVEAFRMLADPLKELALISDAVGPFQIDGSILSDPLQNSGSKFFKVSLLR